MHLVGFVSDLGIALPTPWPWALPTWQGEDFPTLTQGQASSFSEGLGPIDLPSSAMFEVVAFFKKLGILECGCWRLGFLILSHGNTELHI